MDCFTLLIGHFIVLGCCWRRLHVRCIPQQIATTVLSKCVWSPLFHTDIITIIQVQSIVETAPSEAIHLCWKQSLINSAYLLFQSHFLAVFQLLCMATGCEWRPAKPRTGQTFICTDVAIGPIFYLILVPLMPDFNLAIFAIWFNYFYLYFLTLNLLMPDSNLLETLTWSLSRCLVLHDMTWNLSWLPHTIIGTLALSSPRWSVFYFCYSKLSLRGPPCLDCLVWLFVLGIQFPTDHWNDPVLVYPIDQVRQFSAEKVIPYLRQKS